jgi:hypothetical protein
VNHPCLDARGDHALGRGWVADVSLDGEHVWLRGWRDIARVRDNREAQLAVGAVEHEVDERNSMNFSFRSCVSIPPQTDIAQATYPVATTYVIAASTMAMSCSVVPPLTPTPAMTWPSLVSVMPPPIAEYLPPETARRG